MRNMLVLIAGLVCLFLAMLLHLLTASGTIAGALLQPDTYHDLIEELGVALVIGFIISNTIERASRREFNNAIDKRITEIQKNVFRSVYSRNTPPEVIAEIEKLIFEENFVRTNHLVAYEMQLIKARDLDPSDTEIPDIRVVQCEVDLSYTIENISRLPQTYDLRLSIEKPPFARLKDFAKIKSASAYRVDGQEIFLLEDPFDTTSNPDFALYSNQIWVEPGQRIAIRASFRTIKMIDDVELWRSLITSTALTLRVKFPNEAIARGAASLHRKPLAVYDLGAETLEWRIEEPVLPQQGFVFWWRCSNPEML